MWPPPNVYALPSNEEIQQIKDEITSIELEIIHAQLKIDALRNAVTARKAWIAPIRKLPHDLMSQIFLEISLNDWKAPLLLQGVSRQWRDVARGSPRTWALIPLARYDKMGYSKLVALFVERGRNAPLHVFATDDLFGRVRDLAHRIKCLRLNATWIYMRQFSPSQYDFTSLGRLQLNMRKWQEYPGYPGEKIDVVEWNMMRFPNLKSLDLAVCIPYLFAIAAAPKFPAIKQLRVQCVDPSPFTDILTKCAKSLESVILRYDDLPSKLLGRTEERIHLPLLRYLGVSDYGPKGDSRWQLRASTPQLETYFDDGYQPNIHQFNLDTRNVTFLHVTKAPDLSVYPRLVTLRIGAAQQDARLTEVVKALWEHPMCSPNLSFIEYSQSISNGQLLKEANTRLVGRAGETGILVKLVRVNGSDWERSRRWDLCLPTCAEHMPCNPRL